MSEVSLLSPRATEDSFFHFMSRMVQAYVQEEEMRAKHQATLLQLRENAIKEKTKVWLGAGLGAGLEAGGARTCMYMI